MNKQIVRRFQEFAQANGIALDLEQIDFELVSLKHNDFKFVKGLNKYIRKSVEANPGEIPVVGASLDNEGIYSHVTPLDKKDVISEISVSYNKDNARGSRAFYRDYPFIMDRHHLAIIPNQSNIFPKYLFHFLNLFLKEKNFGWGDNVATVEAVQEAEFPLPKPSQGFSSLQIQEILVRFIEHGQSAHQRRLDGCAIIRPILDKMERSVVPRTLEKSRGARKLIKEFLKEKGIELDYEKVEFEEKKVSDIAEFPSVTRVLGGVDLKLDDYYKLEPTEREKYVPLVSGTVENNQISGFIRRDRISENNLSPEPCLSWTRINGSIFFRQEKSVCINDDSFVLIQKKGISDLNYLKNLIPIEASKSGFGWGNKAGVSKIKDLKILVPIDLNELSSIEIQGILTQFFDQYLERVNHNRRVADKLERQIAEYRETYLKLFFKSLKQKAHAD
ncbi:MAG: restriction endonuclease subunit S [Algoriphagus aquaeductus]|uniref:restriction endonuclease subunit S n=1 Tax=Algoriphagus aquaeductus TaxID=475299 RepID=UPI003879261E